MSKHRKPTYRVGTYDTINNHVHRLSKEYEDIQCVEHPTKVNVYIGDGIVYTYMKPTGRWIKRTVNSFNEEVSKPVTGSNIGTMISCMGNDVSTLLLVAEANNKKEEPKNGFISRIISVAFPKKG